MHTLVQEYSPLPKTANNSECRKVLMTVIQVCYLNMSWKKKITRGMEIQISISVPILRPERIIIIIWISFLNAADKRNPECSVISWLQLLLMLLYAVASPSGKYKTLG